MPESLIALASGSSGVPIDDEDSGFALVQGFVAVSRRLAAAMVRSGAPLHEPVS